MTSGKTKVILSIFACLSVFVLLLLIAFLPLDSARWEAAKNRTDQLKREALFRKTPREVLREKPTPGNAWEEYNLALRAGWPEDAGNGGVFFLFATGNANNPERIREMVAEQMPLLERLRLGSQRSDGQYPYNWDRGDEPPSLLRSRMLANLAIAQARILTEAGKTQEAADILLDVMVFARNLSTNGPQLINSIGMAVYITAFEGVRQLILSGKLTENRLADLAKKLEAVDRDFPAPSSMLSYETISAGNRVLASSTWKYSEDFQGRAKAGGWRYAAFPRTTLLEAFEESDAFIQRLRKIDQMSFTVAKKEIDAISADARKSPNVIVRESMPNLSKTMLYHREALTTLRLVHAGMVFRATGKVSTLADPFGTNLLFKQEGTNVKIWSIGPDGKNDNGSGEWGVFRPDMVLEIPR